MALTDKLSAIGEAIRAKTGKSDLLTLDQMPGEIAGITTGGGELPSDVHAVTFMNGNEVLWVRHVADGDNCADVLTKGLIQTPTKESTAQYDYPYYGWGNSSGAYDANILKNITADKTVYAIFTETVRTYTITYYDSDGATVLKTEQLDYGAKPSYVPTKEDVIFMGWEPTVTAVTGDASYTAKWSESVVAYGVINASWQTISELSTAGTAENYFAIGDAKKITLSGNMGSLALNNSYYVYIIGINHNSAVEGTGIQFSGFKSAATSTNQYCLVNGYAQPPNYASDAFWMNTNAKNYGGWAASDLRYGVLGSTNVAPSEYGADKVTTSVGYDATDTCATNPVENTLMSCLPADLRAVMKPITKWTDNVGNADTSKDVEGNVTATVDYLPLLSESEVFSATSYCNDYEPNHQVQYAYYASGKSTVCYQHSSTSSTAQWFLRSPCGAFGNTRRYKSFCAINDSGAITSLTANMSYGVVPVFMV